MLELPEVILPILQYGKVNAGILLAYFGKMRIISTITAHINLLRRGFDKERGP